MSNNILNESNSSFDNLVSISQNESIQSNACPFSDQSCKNQLCLINWQISYQTNYGERLAIVGNIQELGNWKKEDAFNLQWNQNNIWKGQVIVNLSQSQNTQQILEYKYILIDEKNQKTIWEEGQNRFYYYSQILVESYEKANILDNKSQNYNFNNQTSQKNSFQKYQNTYQRINQPLNSQQIQNCSNQMFISDVWNKKSIIFRIKDNQVFNYNNDKSIIQSRSIEQDLQNFQIQLEKTKIVQYYNQNCRKQDNDLPTTPYFNSSSFQIEQEKENGNNLFKKQPVSIPIQKQNANQKVYYITGNHKELGNLRHPQKMNYIPEERCWELQISVDRNTEYIRYFYIQKQENDLFEWEKGSGRFVYMQPLINEQNFNASAIGSCKQSSIYSSHSLSEVEFEQLKSEFVAQQYNKIFSLENITENSIVSTHQCNRDNTELNQNCNNSNKCLFGKIHVNILSKGAFLCENTTNQLCFSLQFDNILDYLYVGPYISNNISDIKQLKKHGIDTVLSLQTDDDMQRRSIDKHHLKELYKKNGIEYYNVPIKDKSFNDFYNKGLSAVEKLNTLLKNQKRTVYLHCTGGISRAPQTAILYMSLYKNYSLKNAIKFVCNKREAAFPDEQLIHQVYNNVFDNNQG